MTIIVETGSGLRVANSYATLAFILAYLTNLGREAENNWSTATTAQQEAAAIAATQYIDTRWATRIKGTRLKTFSGHQALALLPFSGAPLADETITIGNQVYVWKAALTALSSDEILIGATAATCATNLIAAVTTGSTAGTEYSEYMQINDSADAELYAANTDVVLLTALIAGSSGNDIALAETSTNLVVTKIGRASCRERV